MDGLEVFIHEKKGFTLIEIVVVMVILGILAIVAIPKFSDLSQMAKISATQSTLGAVRSILAIEYVNNAAQGNPAFPASLGASNFADNREPVNKLNDQKGVEVVTSEPLGTATSGTVGFWYIVTSGDAGAYSDGAVDTGTW